MIARIGSLIAIIGIASSIASFFDYEHQLLMWMNDMEEIQAWAIRIGLIVVGAALIIFDATRNKARA